MEKPALGRKSQGSEWDQERGARVTGWGVEVHQSALCCSVAGRVSRGACACGLAGLQSLLQPLLKCWWGEPKQIQSLLLAVLHGCSRSLQWFPGSENPRTSIVSSYRPSQSLLSLSIVPSPTWPTFFCLFVCFSIFPSCLQFLSFLFSLSLKQYQQFPVSHLSPGFYPFCYYPVPQDPALQPCSGYVFLLHALWALTGHWASLQRTCMLLLFASVPNVRVGYTQLGREVLLSRRWHGCNQEGIGR